MVCDRRADLPRTLLPSSYSGLWDDGNVVRSRFLWGLGKLDYLVSAVVRVGSDCLSPPVCGGEWSRIIPSGVDCLLRVKGDIGDGPDDCWGFNSCRPALVENWLEASAVSGVDILFTLFDTCADWG